MVAWSGSPSRCRCHLTIKGKNRKLYNIGEHIHTFHSATLSGKKNTLKKRVYGCMWCVCNLVRIQSLVNKGLTYCIAKGTFFAGKIDPIPRGQDRPILPPRVASQYLAASSCTLAEPAILQFYL